MEIKEFNLEKKTAKVKIETFIDILHLEKLVEIGDFVTAKTSRTIFITRGEEKIKGRKEFVLLKIKVEKIEFNDIRNKLRFGGKIVEAPEKIQRGSYHTIEAGIGKTITFEKNEWKNEHLERLEKSKIRVEVIRDPRQMQELLVHLKKNDGLAVYGLEQVKLAATLGAVKVVFVPEEKIGDNEFEEVVKEVENKRGEVKLVSKKYFFGENFVKTYLVAAILRFPIS